MVYHDLDSDLQNKNLKETSAFLAGSGSDDENESISQIVADGDAGHIDDFTEL